MLIDPMIIRSLEHHRHMTFPQNANNLLRQFRRNDIFIHDFAIQFHMITTRRQYSIKSHIQKRLITDVAACPPAAQENLVTILLYLLQRLNRALRDLHVFIP